MSLKVPGIVDLDFEVTEEVSKRTITKIQYVATTHF